MRFLAIIPVVLILAFAGYAFWDLKFNGFVPPVAVDQLAERNPEIDNVMAGHRQALANEMSSAVLPRIEESLEAIKDEYGSESPEYNQALVETALMLSESARTDLAKQYMAEAVEVSRVVYGTNHRETALNLNDLATIKTESEGKNFSDEAIGHLREALEIRLITLDKTHPETVASQVNLADQLYLQWQGGTNLEDTTSLDESASLLKQVLETYEADTENALPMSKAGAELLYARVSFAQGEYATAEKHFRSTLAAIAPETDPSIYVILSTSYAELITSVKEQGRAEEAEEMRLGIVKYLQAKMEEDAAAKAQQQAN